MKENTKKEQDQQNPATQLNQTAIRPKGERLKKRMDALEEEEQYYFTDEETEQPEKKEKRK